MIPSSSDTVFIDTLHISATIGPDCWGKTRPQPLSISVYLNLEPVYLVASGETDDVEKSVHYGLLTKKVTSLIKKKNDEDGWEGVDALVRDVAEEAFELGGECVQSVRVVVEVPKVILLASSYIVDTTLLAEYDQPNAPTTLQPSIRRPRERRLVAKKIEVKEVVVPVVIGVNPPERLAKQRVTSDLVFYEHVGEDSVSHVRYAKVVDALVKVRTPDPLHLLSKPGITKSNDTSAYRSLKIFNTGEVRARAGTSSIQRRKPDRRRHSTCAETECLELRGFFWRGDHEAEAGLCALKGSLSDVLDGISACGVRPLSVSELSLIEAI